MQQGGGAGGGSCPPQILADQLTLSQPGGGWLCPPQYYLPPGFLTLGASLQLVNVKTMRKIFSNFVCFSESPNVKKTDRAFTLTVIIHAWTTKYTHHVGSRELVRKYSNYQRLTPCKINEGTSPYDSEQAKSSRDSKRQQERPKRPTVLKAKPFWVVGPNICKEKLMVVSGSQRRPI